MLKRGYGYRTLPNGKRGKVKVKYSFSGSEKKTLVPFMWYDISSFSVGENAEILRFIKKKLGLTFKLMVTKYNDARMFGVNTIKFSAFLKNGG